MKLTQLGNRQFFHFAPVGVSEVEQILDELACVHTDNSIRPSPLEASYQYFVKKISSSPTSVVSLERLLVESMQNISVVKSSSDDSLEPISAARAVKGSTPELCDVWSMPPQLVRVTHRDDQKSSGWRCPPRPTDPVAKFLDSQ